MVENFEGYNSGDYVMFREPAWSGSTTGVDATSDLVEVSTTQANDILDPDIASTGSNSYKLAWNWNTAGTGFVRSTTYNMTNRPNPRIDLTKGISMYVKVVQGEIDLGLWIRETGSSGIIGGDGTTSGTVEEITSTRRLAAADYWQYVYFDLQNETYRGINGDGTLDGTWGTLESLVIKAVSTSSATTIEMYVDDIYNDLEHAPILPQDDFENFESYSSGTAVMFRNPTFSGNTSGVVSGDTTAIDTTQANDKLDPAIGDPAGSVSLKTQWSWTTAGSGFIRMSSYNVANVPNPLIDLTQRLSFYVLLPAGSLDLQLNIRETGGSGPIGANGGTSGTLERTTPAVRINSSSSWQYVSFDIPNFSYVAHTGDGNLDGSWGTLEALIISAVSTDSTTNFSLYLDDFYQGPEHTPAP